MDGCYDEKGFCLIPKEIRYKQAPVKQPVRMVWNVTEDLGSQIKEAYTLAKKVKMKLSSPSAKINMHNTKFKTTL